MKNALKKEVIGIVQARMGSTRLPGKTLIDICGKPLLEHIVARTKASKLVDDLVIATTVKKEDNAIVDLAERIGVKTFRGNDDDVLDRFYQCAQIARAEIIVRITADDPFKDPQVVDRVTDVMLQGDYDYVSNTIKPTYPEGLDVEVFSFLALQKAWRKANEPSDREHVTPYIWGRPELFRIRNVESELDLSHMRWTLDTVEDLKFTREIYKRLYVPGQLFLMKDILSLLEKNPQLMKINEGVERYAGYKSSLAGRHDDETNRQQRT